MNRCCLLQIDENIKNIKHTKVAKHTKENANKH